MQRFPVARRRSLAEIFRAVEGPTWVALCACYTLWMLATAFHAALGLFWVPLAAIAVAFHSSLQHEALHGHPTRSRLANEALVFPALGLILPYRRYRDTHLRHHDNSVLTDPYDDPESWYLAEGDLSGLPHPLRWVFEANRTLAGRMILGPLLGLYGFLRADLRRLRAGERRIASAWALHLPAVALVLVWLVAVGLPLWQYVLFAVWPAQALLAIRTYIEHKAEADPAHRSVIVEAEAPFRLLFLNNSLHALHHDRPALPWYALPRVYRAERTRIVEGNGAYLIPGYASVFRRYFWRAREPLAHPFLRRGRGDA